MAKKVIEKVVETPKTIETPIVETKENPVLEKEVNNINVVDEKIVDSKKENVLLNSIDKNIDDSFEKINKSTDEFLNSEVEEKPIVEESTEESTEKPIVEESTEESTEKPIVEESTEKPIVEESTKESTEESKEEVFDESSEEKWEKIKKLILLENNFNYLNSGRHLKNELTKETVKKFHDEYIVSDSLSSKEHYELMKLLNEFYSIEDNK